MHNHSHNHNHSVGNIRLAFFLNLGFTIIEIIGGIWTNSVAILADALHDLGDSLALGLSWYLEKKSKSGSNNVYTYGYGRFSLLSAVINGMVLIIGSVFIIAETIPRLTNPEVVHAEGMLYLAILGVIVNGAAVIRTRHGVTMNERFVNLHLLEDVFGWVAVLVVSIVLLFWDIPILDPILSSVILLYVFYNAFKNLRTTMALFLQAVPSEVDIQHLKERIGELQTVRSLHNVHVWSLDGERHILTIHIALHKSVTSLGEVLTLKNQVREYLRDAKVRHSTIEIELHGEDCYNDFD